MSTTPADHVFAPDAQGSRPGTGAILAAVETAGDVSAVVLGKPERIMFEIASEELAGCERVAMIGDHLIADIAGAKRAGLGAILVLTGTTSPADLEHAMILLGSCARKRDTVTESDEKEIMMRGAFLCHLSARTNCTPRSSGWPHSMESIATTIEFVDPTSKLQRDRRLGWAGRSSSCTPQTSARVQACARPPTACG